MISVNRRKIPCPVVAGRESSNRCALPTAYARVSFGVSEIAKFETLPPRISHTQARYASHMNHYGPKQLADAFRTVRKNTLIIARDIPEDLYSFRGAEGTRTVGELLTHIALGGRFQEQVVLTEKRTTMVGFDFLKYRDALIEETNTPRTKDEIIALLQEQGENYAKAVEALSDDFVAESISMPPGAPQASRGRFELLASVKEHEMHHRGQLMLMERMLGITPHLTRENQARVAAMEARMAAEKAKA